MDKAERLEYYRFFAGQALAGLLAHSNFNPRSARTRKQLVELATQYAVDMVEWIDAVETGDAE